MTQFPLSTDQGGLWRRTEAENKQESAELEARPARPGLAASGPGVWGECAGSGGRGVPQGGHQGQQRAQPPPGGGQARQQVRS